MLRTHLYSLSWENGEHERNRMPLEITILAVGSVSPRPPPTGLQAGDFLYKPSTDAPKKTAIVYGMRFTNSKFSLRCGNVLQQQEPGALIQGLNGDSQTKYSELETEAEDALLFTLTSTSKHYGNNHPISSKWANWSQCRHCV
jgi:hypothetical protein